MCRLADLPTTLGCGVAAMAAKMSGPLWTGLDASAFERSMSNIMGGRAWRSAEEDRLECEFCRATDFTRSG